MRSMFAFLRRTLPAASLGGLALAAALAFVTGTAQADRLRDRVQADAFGNLVVWSSSGYKRIVVGRGDLAGELDAYVGGPGSVRSSDRESADDPHVEGGFRYDRRHRYHSGLYRHGNDIYLDNGGCYRPPVFVKGRGYMYGLSDGEMPELAPCLPYNN